VRSVTLAGRRFRLNVETCAIEFLNDNSRTAVRIPVGSVVRVETSHGQLYDNVVLVRLADRELAMFVEDLKARGESVDGEDGG